MVINKVFGHFRGGYRCSTLDWLVSMAGKICKKLHMSRVIIKIISPFVIKNVGMTSFESELILESTSPKPIGTAIIQRDDGWNQDEKYDLQIIIPAYNAEEYIEECINSLLIQETEVKWQAIIINDGSTDRTLDILKKYDSNPLLSIVTQENKGFSGARNAGLNLISSHYIMFLDSDDRLEPGAIEKMMKYAMTNHLEIVEGNFNNWIKGRISQASFSCDGFVNNAIIELRGFPWGKVIRSEIFAKLQYPEQYWYEDSIFSFLIYPQCKKCGTIKDVVYSYRRNPKGVSLSSKGKTKCIDTYYIAELMIKTAITMNINLEYIYNLFLGHILFSYQRISGLNKNIRKAVFVKFCDLHKDFFENNTTDNERLEKIRKSIISRDFGLFEFYCRFL